MKRFHGIFNNVCTALGSVSEWVCFNREIEIFFCDEITFFRSTKQSSTPWNAPVVDFTAVDYILLFHIGERLCFEVLLDFAPLCHCCLVDWYEWYCLWRINFEWLFDSVGWDVCCLGGNFDLIRRRKKSCLTRWEWISDESTQAPWAQADKRQLRVTLESWVRVIVAVVTQCLFDQVRCITSKNFKKNSVKSEDVERAHWKLAQTSIGWYEASSWWTCIDQMRKLSESGHNRFSIIHSKLIFSIPFNCLKKRIIEKENIQIV